MVPAETLPLDLEFSEPAELLDLPFEATEGIAPGGGEIMDLPAYTAAIQPALDAYAREPTFTTAARLTDVIINAAIDCSPPDVGVIISNSWGKDSSSLVGCYCQVLLDRKAAGKRIPQTMIITADTSSEFVAMVARTEEENAHLRRWAQKHGLPIECHVVRPLPKDSLIANLVGCGRPLPRYSQSKSAGAAEWCVDRLKVSVIDKAVALGKSRGTRMLHFLGVRADESTKRAATMQEHSAGLPVGLTRMAMKRRVGGAVAEVLDRQRLGVTPIQHWDHEDLTLFLRLNMAPWNPFSYESLKEIYRMAGGKDEVNGAGECRISLTKDGGLSNTCSDLSGARLGCLLCVKSYNKALHNYASKDGRYHWIKAAHRYIYLGIRQHQLRIADIKLHGWDNTTLFPKTYTFEWRYRLLMLLYRAELDSGFTLVPPEIETAIVAWWQRSGIFTVVPADAREDARQWMETGKFRLRWKASAVNYEDLTLSLSEGLPGGVYAHVMYGDVFKEPLHIANLVTLAGRGNGFYPHLKAYLFRDLSARGGWLTMLTDTPSDMGRRLNTDALNGFSGFALELVGTRDLTGWERKLLRGRMFFYRHARGELEQRIAGLTGRPWVPGDTYDNPVATDLNDILLANLNLFDPCGEHALANHWAESNCIASLRGRIQPAQLGEVINPIARAVILSDKLSDVHLAKRRYILQEHRQLLDRLGSDAKMAGDDAARALVKSLIQDGWRAEGTLRDYLAYIQTMRELDDGIRQGWLNTELINRLAYIARTFLYDPGYAKDLLNDIERLLFPEPLAPASEPPLLAVA